MQEMQVQSLGWEDPLEKEMQPTPNPCLGHPMARDVHGVTKESDMT